MAPQRTFYAWADGDRFKLSLFADRSAAANSYQTQDALIAEVRARRGKLEWLKEENVAD